MNLDSDIEMQEQNETLKRKYDKSTAAIKKRRYDCQKNCSALGEGVELIETAFKGRILTYRLYSCHSSADVSEFIDYYQEKMISLINEKLDLFFNIKISIELFGRFIQQSEEVEDIKHFNTGFYLICKSTNLQEVFEEIIEVLKKRLTDFNDKNSGWTFHQFLYVDLKLNKVDPLRASSYIKLPKQIEAKKAVLNIQNMDEKCFIWSILASLHPVDINANRVSNYTSFYDELNITNLKFPVKLKDIAKFENLNHISINVYGLENDMNIVLLHYRKRREKRHIDLLLIKGNNDKAHYCLIKSLSRLLSKQLSRKKVAKHLCDGCFSYFDTDQKLNTHQLESCGHVPVEIPNEDTKIKYGETVPNNTLKFINFERKLKIPFVVYADFETILEPWHDYNPTSSNTLRTHQHIPHSFAYYIKCNYNDSKSIFKIFRGEYPEKMFVKWLEDDCKLIYNYMKDIVPMLPLTEKDNIEFDQAKICHICEKSIQRQDKVYDHCHLTGRFRGAAHKTCNLHYKTPEFIPVFFHNLSNFDSHLFIKALATKGSKLEVLPHNKEKYISFTKYISVQNRSQYKDSKINLNLKLRFLDSFRFMSSSLDKLSQNLKSEECHNVRKFYPNDNEFSLVRMKGVFPYSYVDSFSKLEASELPSIDEFYNDLRKESIKDDDYKRAQAVWQQFKCKTLGDYSDIYLKSDVLILADVFEKFREVCLDAYHLDPCHYFTAPGLSFDAALKKTSIILELFTDIDKVHFIKRGIRGGVSQCSVRSAQANNTFVTGHNPLEPTSWIVYLDATNLYGAAMSQKLPTSNFRWLNESEIQVIESKIQNFNIDTTSNIGYILEVDLEYPEKLHHLHNDLPFCPESIVPENSKINISKLIPNFYSKSKYVIHIQNLVQALKHGIILVKIHRVLTFSQSEWLNTYIDKNTEKRNNATNKFEKDFYKLMNNAVFGKTMENVEKRLDLKLLTHWNNIGRKPGAKQWISNVRFKDYTIFDENLVAITLFKNKILYNKPIYVGFSILDISKTIVYDFLYNYIKPKYGDNAILLYTDTDSLILKIETDNFYTDINKNLDKFDTSNYAKDNQHGVCVNQSVIGRMKDEYAGKVIWEFCGTGAKAYCVNANGELTKKAKGVDKHIINKELTLANFQNTVNNPGSQIYREMKTFKSHLHTIYIELKNKVALSYNDDKRFIIPGSYNTLALGHRDIKNYRESSNN